MEELYSLFLREKRYLANLSPRTIRYYEVVFRVWDARIGRVPDRENVKEFVMGLQERKLSPSTINSYIRAINGFSTWLHGEGHIPERVRIPKIKEPHKGLALFSETHIKRLLGYKPKTFARKRLYAMVVLAIDTGARIDEMLSLTRSGVDWDNLLVTVEGKGDKRRVLPISPECRKVLYKFLQAHTHELAFPGPYGGKLVYVGVLDHFKRLCAELGITGVRTSWHTLRHTFATSYLRDGGNLIYLSRILGHSDIAVTKIYVQNRTEDLALVHKKTSLVARLR